MLLEKLNKDIIASLKDKNRQKTTTLRQLKDRIEKKSKEMKRSLNEVEENVELSKIIKQFKEEIEGFLKVNRMDTVEKLQEDIAILEAYLPKQLTAEEVFDIIAETYNELINSGVQITRGTITKSVLAKTAGRADNKSVVSVISSWIEREEVKI